MLVQIMGEVYFVLRNTGDNDKKCFFLSKCCIRLLSIEIIEPNYNKTCNGNRVCLNKGCGCGL